ncbi:MAG TPA: CBS domain-containing protein [Aggregatilineales bacterium]|nr:CBS domain-containing protein [Aggregatilineales bacterium]
MRVQDILKKKSTGVFTVRPHHSLREASEIMAGKNIGALIVVDDSNAPVGIITERDIVRQVAKTTDAVGTLTVGDVMSRDLVIALPDDDIAYLGSTMTNKRIRHLPVMQDGQLAGIVSIGDVVKAQLDYFEGEARTLQQYITGGYA